MASPPTPRQCSRPGWMGLGATCSSGSVPACGRGLGMRWSLRSLLTQTILSFYETGFFWYFKFCPSGLLKGAVLPCCFRYGPDNCFFSGSVICAELNGARLV